MSPAELCRMAASPETPPEDLGRLVRHPNWHARAAVAANPAVPLEHLSTLARDSAWGVRYGLASSPNLDAEIAAALATDLAPIRLLLAANTAVPQDVIATLTADDDEYVRGLAVSNPACPAEYLRDAASGLQRPAWVLNGIACNPACPQDLRDEIETWVVLGGGNGDVDFHPVTCVGHPGIEDPTAGGEHETAAYQRLGSERRVDDPHPLFKARSHQGGKALSYIDAKRLLLDPEPKVRLSVLPRRGSIPGQRLSSLLHNEPFEPIRTSVASILIREVEAANQAAARQKTAVVRQTRAASDGAWWTTVWVGGAVMLGVLLVLSAVGDTSGPPEADFPSAFADPFALPAGPSVAAAGGAELQASRHPDAVTGKLTIRAGDSALQVRSLRTRYSDGSSRSALLVAHELPVSIQASGTAEVFVLVVGATHLSVELVAAGEVETVTVPFPDPAQAEGSGAQNSMTGSQP